MRESDENGEWHELRASELEMAAQMLYGWEIERQKKLDAIESGLKEINRRLGGAE